MVTEDATHLACAKFSLILGIRACNRNTEFQIPAYTSLYYIVLSPRFKVQKPVFNLIRYITKYFNY